MGMKRERWNRMEEQVLSTDASADSAMGTRRHAMRSTNSSPKVGTRCGWNLWRYWVVLRQQKEAKGGGLPVTRPKTNNHGGPGGERCASCTTVEAVA